MKFAIIVLAGAAAIATAAWADEIHNNTVRVDHDLKDAIAGFHIMAAEHGPDFGGHFDRAEQLTRAADAERQAGMVYFRQRHPGWQ